MSIKLYTRLETRKALRISDNTLAAIVETGELTPVIPNPVSLKPRWKFAETDVLAYFERRKRHFRSTNGRKKGRRRSNFSVIS